MVCHAACRCSVDEQKEKARACCELLVCVCVEEKQNNNIIISRHEDERAAALVGGTPESDGSCPPWRLGEFGPWRAILMGQAARLWPVAAASPGRNETLRLGRQLGPVSCDNAIALCDSVSLRGPMGDDVYSSPVMRTQ